MTLSAASLNERLSELHKLTAQTPLFNPVFQLGLDVSRDLEGGGADLAAIGDLISELECNALQARAKQVHNLVQPTGVDENKARLRALIAQTAQRGFESFRTVWEHPLLNCVFTGHPTFLLSDAQSEAVANAASSGNISAEMVCTLADVRAPITIGHEHDRAIAAMRRAGTARDVVTSIVLDVASQYWPDRWRSLKPNPYTLATWVGYDMDGRTDINWFVSIRFRLAEKAARLSDYHAMLAAIDAGLPVVA
jgi:phosphoenolpyruvate carboxylase